jgi:hypothetical protein
MRQAAKHAPEKKLRALSSVRSSAKLLASKLKLLNATPGAPTTP